MNNALMNVWSSREANNWSWVPVVGSLLGGVLGSFSYILLIEMHHKADYEMEGEVELQSVVSSRPIPSYALSVENEKGLDNPGFGEGKRSVNLNNEKPLILGMPGGVSYLHGVEK